jgi:ribonuclease III
VAQARLGITPHYRLVREEGPSHDRTFVVEVVLGTLVAGRGEGRSKRQAEQAAAAEALQDEGWRTDAGSPGGE